MCLSPWSFEIMKGKKKAQCCSDYELVCDKCVAYKTIVCIIIRDLVICAIVMQTLTVLGWLLLCRSDWFLFDWHENKVCVMIKCWASGRAGWLAMCLGVSRTWTLWLSQTPYIHRQYEYRYECDKCQTLHDGTGHWCFICSYHFELAWVYFSVMAVSGIFYVVVWFSWNVLW